MKQRSLRLTVFLTCSVLSATCTGAAEFGFGKVDVTPTEPLRLSGYGSRSQPSEGIDQPLWVRAMAMKAESGRISVLVSVDSIGVPGAMTERIAAKLRERNHIAREHFVLCVTHAHTSPQLANALTNLFAVPMTPEQEAKTKHYTERFEQQIIAAVQQAIRGLAPGTLSFAQGEATFAVNRRVLKDGHWAGFGVQSDGPVDHSVPVLKVVGKDGALRGVVFNYACHCTTLGGNHNRIGGDWAGYATAALEAAYPGAVALCTIGCAADQNPNPRGELAMAQDHGQTMAREVRRVMDGTMDEIRSGMNASFACVKLTSEVPAQEELRQRLTTKRPQNRRHTQNLLAVYERNEKVPNTYPMPIQVWRFGDQLTMVFLSGEVVVDYSVRLKSELPGQHVWVTAYANDLFAYVTSERMQAEGGYEVDSSMIYYSRPGRWVAGTEDSVIHRVHEIAEACETQASR